MVTIRERTQMNLWDKKRYRETQIPDLPNFDLVEDKVDKLTNVIQRKHGYVVGRDFIYYTYAATKIVLEITLRAEEGNYKQRIVIWPRIKPKKYSRGAFQSNHRQPKRTSREVQRKY